MVSGLLLIAFIFFAFAQAAVVRGGSQSAADAAALAAAQESRDELYQLFLDIIEGGEGDLDDVLEGIGFEVGSACADAAPRLAELNNAALTACVAQYGEPQGYSVAVEMEGPVGDSSRTANTEATAVLDARCDGATEDGGHVELSCEDGDWSFDVEDEADRPEPRDLFAVYLDDRRE